MLGEASNRLDEGILDLHVPVRQLAFGLGVLLDRSEGRTLRWWYMKKTQTGIGVQFLGR